MTASENIHTFVSAELHIDSRELTPAQISTALGLEPTRIHLKGERLTQLDSELRHKSNSFVLVIRRTAEWPTSFLATDALQQALEELLLKVEPVADQLATLREKLSIGVKCVYGATPKPECVQLSADLLRRLAVLDIPLTVWLTTVTRQQRQERDSSHESAAPS